MQYYTNVYWRNIIVYFLVNPKFKYKKFQAARVPKVSKFSLLKIQFPLWIPTDFGPFLLILRASRSDEFVSAAKKKSQTYRKKTRKPYRRKPGEKSFPTLLTRTDQQKEYFPLDLKVSSMLYLNIINIVEQSKIETMAKVLAWTFAHPSGLSFRLPFRGSPEPQFPCVLWLTHVTTIGPRF